MRWLIILPLLFIGLVIGIGVYLQPSDFAQCEAVPAATGPCAKADAIVVVSGGDTTARTAAGIDPVCPTMSALAKLTMMKS